MIKITVIIVTINDIIARKFTYLLNTEIPKMVNKRVY